MDMNKLNWAAGFFEGEGCIRTNKGNPKRMYKRWTMGFQVINTDLETIIKFKEGVCGLGDIRGPHGPYKGSMQKKPFYCWMANRFSEVVALKGLLFPLLSERRKQQIIDAHNAVEASKVR